MKFGFELEYFCINEAKAIGEVDKPCLVPDGLPYDECGWLVEVRSEPHTVIKKAIFLLKAEVEHVEAVAQRKGVKLGKVPLLAIPRDLKVKAAREHSKGRLTYRNVYGHETHRNGTNLATASLHISVTEERKFHYLKKVDTSHYEPSSFSYPGFVDHAKLIIGLDLAFKDEIRKARRNPGFYEVKGDGRLEYRSLPNDVDLDKVERELKRLFPEGRD